MKNPTGSSKPPLVTSTATNPNRKIGRISNLNSNGAVANSGLRRSGNGRSEAPSVARNPAVNPNLSGSHFPKQLSPIYGTSSSNDGERRTNGGSLENHDVKVNYTVEVTNLNEYKHATGNGIDGTTKLPSRPSSRASSPASSHEDIFHSVEDLTIDAVSDNSLKVDMGIEDRMEFIVSEKLLPLESNIRSQYHSLPNLTSISTTVRKSSLRVKRPMVVSRNAWGTENNNGDSNKLDKSSKVVVKDKGFNNRQNKSPQPAFTVSTKSSRARTINTRSPGKVSPSSSPPASQRSSLREFVQEDSIVENEILQRKILDLEISNKTLRNMTNSLEDKVKSQTEYIQQLQEYIHNFTDSNEDSSKVLKVMDDVELQNAKFKGNSSDIRVGDHNKMLAQLCERTQTMVYEARKALNLETPLDEVIDFKDPSEVVPASSSQDIPSLLPEPLTEQPQQCNIEVSPEPPSLSEITSSCLSEASQPNPVPALHPILVPSVTSSAQTSPSSSSSCPPPSVVTSDISQFNDTTNTPALLQCPPDKKECASPSNCDIPSPLIGEQCLATPNLSDFPSSSPSPPSTAILFHQPPLLNLVKHLIHYTYLLDHVRLSDTSSSSPLRNDDHAHTRQPPPFTAKKSNPIHPLSLSASRKGLGLALSIKEEDKHRTKRTKLERVIVRLKAVVVEIAQQVGAPMDEIDDFADNDATSQSLMNDSSRSSLSSLVHSISTDTWPNLTSASVESSVVDDGLSPSEDGLSMVSSLTVVSEPLHEFIQNKRHPVKLKENSNLGAEAALEGSMGGNLRMISRLGSNRMDDIRKRTGRVASEP